MKGTTLNVEQWVIAIVTLLFTLYVSIGISIIVSKTFQHNVYGVCGLTDGIVFTAIPIAIVSPLLKFINIGGYIGILSRWWAKRPGNRLQVNQT